MSKRIIIRDWKRYRDGYQELLTTTCLKIDCLDIDCPGVPGVIPLAYEGLVHFVEASSFFTSRTTVRRIDMQLCVDYEDRKFYVSLQRHYEVMRGAMIRQEPDGRKRWAWFNNIVWWMDAMHARKEEIDLQRYALALEGV